MTRPITSGFVVALILASTSAGPSAQDAAAVVAAASRTMGVEALKTAQFSATGHDFALGQAPNPSSPWPKFLNKTYTRAIDFEAAASRVDRVRVQAENPPRGGGQQPVIGEQKQSQTIVVKPDTPWAQQIEIWMLPHGFLRAAAKKTPTLELHHMKNFNHHDGTLIAYLPKEKILFQADAYNPQAATATPPSPYTVSLFDNIQRLKLDVTRIIPVHYPADNRTITLAELTRWAGKSSS